MSFQYIKVDETKKWKQDFLTHYGVTKMTATYAFNPEEHVHCCEVTPSYWMRYLGTEPDMDWDITEEAKEEFDEQMMLAELHGGESDCYMHVRVVQGMKPKDVNKDCETLDDVAEEFCANPW